MIVFVDTTIWSLALRRHRPKTNEQILIDELAELITEYRAFLIGPIRQEILSGIPSPKQFEMIRQHLSAFEDLPIVEADYEQAARLFNTCRKKGVQGSHIDFLICAVATRHSAPVFTTDKDCRNYALHLDLELHKPRKG